MTIASPTIIELVKGLNTIRASEDEEEKVYELIDSFIVLNLDKPSAILAGRIESNLKERSEMIDLEDIMIAAITITRNEKLVTRNEKHFSRIKGLGVRGY